MLTIPGLTETVHQLTKFQYEAQRIYFFEIYSALEVCSRRGAIQIHVYLYLNFYGDILGYREKMS